MIDKFKASNGVEIAVRGGLCWACEGHHYCPHSDSPEGLAIKEFGKGCFVLEVELKDRQVTL